MSCCLPGCTCRRHLATGRPPGYGTPADGRFWLKVERRGYDECWPWTGAMAKSPGGLTYGKFWVPGDWLGLDREKVCRGAHRVAFYLVHGRWPKPNALHGCDYPLCCNAENPKHIHEGTLKQNTAEMYARGRHPGPPVLMGSRANRSKLSDEQALEVIARYGPGGIVSQEALAAEYGVSQFAISYTLRGKRRSLQ